MSSKPTTISGTVENTLSIIEALRQIDPALDIRGETQTAMAKKMERYNIIISQMAALDAQGTTLMNERDKLLDSFTQLPVFTREVVAGKYGKDSNEYELVGGTRTSEIVRGGGRKPKTAKTNGDGSAA